MMFEVAAGRALFERSDDENKVWASVKQWCSARSPKHADARQHENHTQRLKAQMAVRIRLCPAPLEWRAVAFHLCLPSASERSSLTHEMGALLAKLSEQPIVFY